MTNYYGSTRFRFYFPCAEMGILDCTYLNVKYMYIDRKIHKQGQVHVDIVCSTLRVCNMYLLAVKEFHVTFDSDMP